MCFLRKPSADRITAFLAWQVQAPFSYPHVGKTREQPPSDYVLDHRRACLGKGPEAFAAGCSALRAWKMFDLGWVEACPTQTPIEVGSVVGILAYCGVAWCLNACRIVYVVNEPRRFGFAYGTLPAHVESGEERFLIEWLEDDTVWYDLLAFSRPAHWTVKLCYPIARRFQKRFAKGSMAAMQRAVQDTLEREP